MFVIDSGYCKLKVRDDTGGRVLGLHLEPVQHRAAKSGPGLLCQVHERVAEVSG